MYSETPSFKTVPRRLAHKNHRGTIDHVAKKLWTWIFAHKKNPIYEKNTRKNDKRFRSYMARKIKISTSEFLNQFHQEVDTPPFF